MRETDSVQSIINTMLEEKGALRILDLREELGEERFCRVERYVYSILKKLQNDNAISRVGSCIFVHLRA